MFSLLIKYSLLSTAVLLAFIPFSNEKEHDPELFVTGGMLEDKHQVAKYTVSLQRKKYIKKYFGYFHFCSGSIIGKKKILTAAHCLCNDEGEKYSEGYLVVIVGLRNRFEKTRKTRIMHPSELIVHKDFSLEKNNNTAYDIGLIILKESIAYAHDRIAQIGLPVAPAPVNKHCAIGGWGRVFHGGPMPAELFFAEVRVFSPAECKKLLKKLYASEIICAGDSNGWKQDACEGDSGGPLICEDTVVGIVSAGFECGNVPLPGLYTDVYQFLEWIENRGRSSNLNWLFIVLVLVLAIRCL